jgi:glycosyltransferase involved in cell wall biosynthesis
MVIVYMLTSLGMGGAERQVLGLASRMADRGHAVKLLVLRPPLSEQWPTALPVIHLNMRRSPGSVLKGFYRAQRFLRGYRPDLVHSHTFHANLVARLLRLFVPAPVVLSTVHNVYEGGLHRMIAYRLTDSLCKRTTAVSAVAAERYVQLKAVPRHKCVVVTNGIETAHFLSNAARRMNVRTSMDVVDKFVWLTAGRLAPAKDIPNLLAAFKTVRATHPDVELWIAGEGNVKGDKREAGVSVEHGSLEQVRWLGLRRDLPALLDAADGFVLASAWEGMPLVVGEAMAMEKPVVATDVGGVRELMGEAGMLVPPKNPDALAAAMLVLMRSSVEARQKLGRKARVRIEDYFNIETRAQQWESLYRTLFEFHRDRSIALDG